MAKSLAQELTKTILTEHGYKSLPTLLADMAVTVIRKMAMILHPKKKEKLKHQMLKKEDLLSVESKNASDIFYYPRL